MFKRNDIVFWLRYDSGHNSQWQGGVRICLSELCKIIKENKGDVEKSVKKCVDLCRNQYSWED
jgi:hypothetical protein